MKQDSTIKTINNATFCSPSSNILICGMHRSGTSLTGKFFENIGYNFGHESDLVSAREENKEGFWERKDVIQLNNRILSLYGSSWDYPLLIKADLIRDIATNNMFNLADEAKQIIAGLEYPFAIKDPRLSLLLPFWKEIIKDSKIVIVVRNPLEVANSINKRNQFSKHLGLMLWLKYYQCILTYSEKSDRFFLFNDSLIKADEGLIERISNYLNLNPIENIRNAINSSVNKLLISNGGAPDPEIILKAPYHKEIIKLWKIMRLESNY